MSNITMPGNTPPRSLRYLRLSITDRCNFGCIYCGDSKRRTCLPHSCILRFEEILRMAKIAARLGIGKIRVTGGEPFVRKNCLDLLFRLRSALPHAILCLTTNGSLLDPFLDDLCRLGLESINISLDTFDRETFAKITGTDALPGVLNNISGLLSRDQRIKLNAVALGGVTDVQMADFVYAARTMPIDMRFIEFMPIGVTGMGNCGNRLVSETLLRLAGKYARLSPVVTRNDPFAGPARMYEIAGGKGRIGFISAISDHFCGSCNRLRLTSDGKIKLCLFEEREYNIAGMLRNDGVSDASIGRALKAMWRLKPMGCDILAGKRGIIASSRGMTAIGG